MAFAAGLQTPGFQADAFQTGRRVTDGVQVRKVNLDQFTIEAVGADLFRDASPDDRVTVPLGLKEIHPAASGRG